MVLVLVVEKSTETDPYQGGVISRVLLKLMFDDVRPGQPAEADLRQALEHPGTDAGFSQEGQVVLEKPIHPAESRFALSLGEVVPDIQGQDLDGKTHRLSDHRGKVVVISFSATWCGPCKPYYPVLRDLPTQFGDAVAVVSVQQDDDADAVRERIADGTYTWQVWFEGRKRGPLHAGWGLFKVPTTFVLDREGVLRSIDPKPEDLLSVVGEWVDA